MKVQCDVDEITLENDEGFDVDSVEVTCGRCGHSATAFGTSGASVRRCLATLREECPKGENNFYVAEGDHDD